MTIQLKVGGRYKDRRGEVVRITTKTDDPIYPFESESDCYMADGRYYSSGTRRSDLIEEITTKPPPEQIAREWAEYSGEAAAQMAATSDHQPLPAESALTAQVGGSHYRDMTIQPVEYIHANGIAFMEGNVIKYVSRWRAKGGVADLKKARHHLDLLIELEEAKA